MLPNIKSNDTLNNPTKTKTRETYEFIYTKSKDNFSKNTPMEPEGENKTLVVTSLEVHKSVFIVIKPNSNFSTYTAGYLEDVETKSKHESIDRTKKG